MNPKKNLKKTSLPKDSKDTLLRLKRKWQHTSKIIINFPIDYFATFLKIDITLLINLLVDSGIITQPIIYHWLNEPEVHLTLSLAAKDALRNRSFPASN